MANNCLLSCPLFSCLDRGLHSPCCFPAAWLGAGRRGPSDGCSLADDGEELRLSRGYLCSASLLPPGDELFRFQTNSDSKLQRFLMALIFFLCQCTDGEAKQQRLYDAGGVQQIPAVEGNSKRRRLRSENKAAEAEASPSQRTRRAFLRFRTRTRTRREMLHVSQRMGKIGQRDQASSSSVSRAIDWRS
ncbi:unnamed protein product [Miscanthus lutarioriparius]|uniref:Uncharacterized protein n=1 Tax=Miscanthus lutarioriparius TaxID=422564 RepID=A0A811MRY4_9POAL|nr:unnamed protein product [Miscanthus lutarioriparius]